MDSTKTVKTQNNIEYIEHVLNNIVNFDKDIQESKFDTLQNDVATCSCNYGENRSYEVVNE